jgi:hypothetical protein
MRGCFIKWTLSDQKFSGGGDEEKFKYHMVKWENICLPKDFGGGVGKINTKILNEAFLIKWVWRIYNQEGDPCCDLLRRKYLKNKPLASCKTNRVPILARIDKVKHNFKWGLPLKLIMGKMSFFGKMCGLAKHHLSYPSQSCMSTVGRSCDLLMIVGGGMSG